MPRYKKPITDPHTEQSLTAELRALLGVYALYTQVQAAIDEMDLQDDLTDTARHLLLRLEQPMRMGELARLSMMLPSTVTVQVDLLEKLGLVQRARDPRDRRAWVLSLSDKGQEHRKTLLQLASDLFHSTTGFDDAETHAFATLTDKARQNILNTILTRSPE